MIVSVSSSGGGSQCGSGAVGANAVGPPQGGAQPQQQQHQQHQQQQQQQAIALAAASLAPTSGPIYGKMVVTSTKASASFPVGLSSMSPLPPPEQAQSQQHIVQRHPPPLSADARLRMIQVPHPPQSVSLPQKPVRPSALPSHTLATRPSPPRLPQTPVAHVAHQPRVLHHAVLQSASSVCQQAQSPFTQQEQRAFSHIVINSKSGALPVLPRQPSTVVAPATLLAGSGHQSSLLAAPPSALIPFPVSRASLQPPTNLLPHPLNTSTALSMPPNGLNHALLASKRVRNVSSFAAINGAAAIRGAEAMGHRLRQDSIEENESHEVNTYAPRHRVPSGRVGGRSNHLSTKQFNLQIPAALQDHNYASRPPPTPPPPSVPSPPPTLPVSFVQKESETGPAFTNSPESATNSVVATAQTILPQQDLTMEVNKSVPTKESPYEASEGTSIAPETRMVQQSSNSIQTAGVGPMQPLIEDEPTNSASSSNGEIEPPVDADEDSITRCICDFLHDDGYMICCDKCSVWQHVVCMDLDRNNIPDVYLCEVCDPRPVDRRRARALQARRRNELMNNSSSSEEGILKELHIQRKSFKKSQDKRPVAKLQNILLGKKHKERGNKNNSASEKTLLSRERKRKTKREVAKESNSMTEEISENPSQKRTKYSCLTATAKSTVEAHKLDDVTEQKEEEEEIVIFPSKVDVGQQLRLLVDRYSEAVTNHYAPELRARLVGNKLTMRTSELRPTVLASPAKGHASLQGNGLKVLLASTSVESGTPVIECKGRFMLSSQFRSSLLQSKAKSPHPYIFFYKLADNLEICLDGITYGNDSRFCRRSSRPNAELKHIIDKGSLHIFIVSSQLIGKDQEVFLPLDSHFACNPVPALKSTNDIVKEQKKQNNTLDDSKKLTKKSVVKQSKKGLSGGKTAAKTKSSAEKLKEVTDSPVNVSKSAPDDEENENLEPKSKSKNVIKEEELASADENNAFSKAKSSPNKMGLPDDKGLIVGVNTINYDASSSVKNKAKSREERKMEMIMKAFEEMERAEQRKKEHQQQEGHSQPNRSKSSEGLNAKQRRNSSKQTDSANDLSSADESLKNEHKLLKRRGKRIGTPNKSRKMERRRSRIASGGSGSNPSESETTNLNAGPTWDPASAPVSSSSGAQPFRFPKTKKSMMSEWLQESNEGVANGDDDVSSHYLRGSRSPPGIATHLLRQSAMGSGSCKSVWSAKKRWLRQAISEDQSEETNELNIASANGMCSSPTESNLTDQNTPLKKRRLAASFKDGVGDDDEEESVKREDQSQCVKTEEYPNSLKKKLLQNLVLEAVLDKAIEDISGQQEHDTKEENGNGSCAFSEEDKSTTGPLMESIGSCGDFKEEENTTFRRAEETVGMKVELKENLEQNDHPKVKKEGVSSRKESSADHKQSALPSVLRPPDQSSPFKSFFQSDVSLEQIQAELTADADDVKTPGANMAVETMRNGNASALDTDNSPKETTLKVKDPKTSMAVVISGQEESLPESLPRTPKVESLTTEATVLASTTAMTVEATSTVGAETIAKDLQGKRPTSMQPAGDLALEKRKDCLTTTATEKPREKKKVSLADYKRRRKQAVKNPNPTADALNSGSSIVDNVTKTNNDISNSRYAAISTLIDIQDRDSDGPGTPTLDEDDSGACDSPASNCFLPKLGSLPIFEKIARTKQHQNRLPGTDLDVKNDLAPDDGPREDLTERLKKEFGLETTINNCGGSDELSDVSTATDEISNDDVKNSAVVLSSRMSEVADSTEHSHRHSSKALLKDDERVGFTPNKTLVPSRFHSSSFPIPPPYPVRAGDQPKQTPSSLPRIPPYPPPLRHTAAHPRASVPDNRLGERQSRSRFSERGSVGRVNEVYVTNNRSSSGSSQQHSSNSRESSLSHYHRHPSNTGSNVGVHGHRSGRDYRSSGRHGDSHHRHYRGSGSHRSRLQPGGSSNNSTSSSRGWSHK